VKCQATRSRDQNRKGARQLLIDKLDILENGDQSRVAIKGAAKARKKASKTKKAKRKYRKDGEDEGEEADGEATSLAKRDSEGTNLEGEDGERIVTEMRETGQVLEWVEEERRVENAEEVWGDPTDVKADIRASIDGTSIAPKKLEKMGDGDEKDYGTEKRRHTER
jgi:hypothetical protein